MRKHIILCNIAAFFSATTAVAVVVEEEPPPVCYTITGTMKVTEDAECSIKKSYLRSSDPPQFIGTCYKSVITLPIKNGVRTIIAIGYSGSTAEDGPSSALKTPMLLHEKDFPADFRSGETYTPSEISMLSAKETARIFTARNVIDFGNLGKLETATVGISLLKADNAGKPIVSQSTKIHRILGGDGRFMAAGGALYSTGSHIKGKLCIPSEFRPNLPFDQKK